MPSSTPAKRNTLRKVAVALLWLALWAGAAALVGRDLLLPGPVTTAKTLVRLMGDAAFWRGCAATLLRIVTGFLLGLLCGGLLGALCWRFSFCNAFFSPFLSIIKAVQQIKRNTGRIVKVVTFDNDFDDIAPLLDVPFQSIKQNGYEIGKTAAEQLHNLITGADKHKKFIIT